MNLMALITARFSGLSFFTPPAEKPIQELTPNTSRNERSSSTKKTAAAAVSAYRSTSIVCGESACDAVKAVGSRRFLSTDRDTPMLPLPACDISRCNCKYLHHDDRREDDNDRRLAAALQTALYEDGGNQSRRLKKRGRRYTDL